MNVNLGEAGELRDLAAQIEQITAQTGQILLTDTAVWSVTQADGSPLPELSKAFFEHGSPGVRALKPLLTVPDLLLTASFGGQSRSVKAKVAA